MFQVCTEWGYFFVSTFHSKQLNALTKAFNKTAPPDQAYPRIVSRLLTLEVASRICHQVSFGFLNMFAENSHLFAGLPTWELLLRTLAAEYHFCERYWRF